VSPEQLPLLDVAPAPALWRQRCECGAAELDDCACDFTEDDHDDDR